MPVFHAHIPAGRFSKEQKKAIGNALNQSLVEALVQHPSNSFNNCLAANKVAGA